MAGGQVRVPVMQDDAGLQLMTSAGYTERLSPWQLNVAAAAYSLAHPSSDRCNGFSYSCPLSTSSSTALDLTTNKIVKNFTSVS